VLPLEGAASPWDVFMQLSPMGVASSAALLAPLRLGGPGVRPPPGLPPPACAAPRRAPPLPTLLSSLPQKVTFSAKGCLYGGRADRPGDEDLESEASSTCASSRLPSSIGDDAAAPTPRAAPAALRLQDLLQPAPAAALEAPEAGPTSAPCLVLHLSRALAGGAAGGAGPGASPDGSPAEAGEEDGEDEEVIDALTSGPAVPAPPSCSSVGSARHHEGLCRPCDFVHRGRCRAGFSCQFCHLCTAEDYFRRKSQRKMRRRILCRQHEREAA